MRKKRWFLLTIIYLLSISSCNEDNGGNNNPGNEFNRQMMLDNLGTNIILPNYEDLQFKINDFSTKYDDFITAPSPSNLTALRDAFLLVYMQWQSVSFYEFGEAERIIFRNSMNNFPTDFNTIEANIENGGYNLDAISNIDAIGLPAIDYLLFEPGKTDEEIIANLTENDNYQNRQQYLYDLIQLAQTKTNQIVNSWSLSGNNYLNEFIKADGTDIGSSLGLLVNSLNIHVEKYARDNKIGIPLGVRSLGIPVPGNIESRYSKNSIALAIANISAIHDFYMGKSESDGPGLYDNLKSLGIQYDNELLADAIKNQMTSLNNALTLIPEPFESTVEDNKTPVEAAYTEFQKLVILLKVDMPSALGVLITYQDNDGD